MAIDNDEPIPQNSVENETKAIIFHFPANISGMLHSKKNTHKYENIKDISFETRE